MGNLGSEVGHLLYLVRSTEVWGVRSQLSHDFGFDKQDVLIKTCDRVLDFLKSPSILKVCVCVCVRWSVLTVSRCVRA